MAFYGFSVPGRPGAIYRPGPSAQCGRKRYALTRDEIHDITQASDSIKGLSDANIIADKGYDSTGIGTYTRNAILWNTFFNRIKYFRRIATRYEKTKLFRHVATCLYPRLVELLKTGA